MPWQVPKMAPRSPKIYADQGFFNHPFSAARHLLHDWAGTVNNFWCGVSGPICLKQLSDRRYLDYSMCSDLNKRSGQMAKITLYYRLRCIWPLVLLRSPWRLWSRFFRSDNCFGKLRYKTPHKKNFTSVVQFWPEWRPAENGCWKTVTSKTTFYDTVIFTIWLLVFLRTPWRLWSRFFRSDNCFGKLRYKTPHKKLFTAPDQFLKQMAGGGKWMLKNGYFLFIKIGLLLHFWGQCLRLYGKPITIKKWTWFLDMLSNLV